MARKVVLTETVTAELLPQLPPLRAAEPRGAGAAPGGVAGAITDAVAAVAVAVEAAAPGLSLGEQLTAVSTALAHAAHAATNQQLATVTLADASTVRAVSAILGAARPVRRRHHRT